MNNDLISRSALREDLRSFFPSEVLEGIEPKTLFAQIMHDIDNVPTVENITVFCENADEKTIEDLKAELQRVMFEKPQCNQIAWEQGYECGYRQAKEDAIRRIAEQYSEHHELIPEWLSIGDMKGGTE